MRGFALVCAVFASTNIYAQTWNGGGANNLWSNGANWSVAPVNNGTAALAFAGSARLTPDMDANWNILSLTFNSGAGAFTLSSTGSFVLTIQGGGITNNSTSTETINNAITLGAAQTWNATSGNLNFGANITNGGFLLTIGGGSNTSAVGIISGTGGLTKNGTGTLTLTGANSYTGATTISAGILNVQHATGLGTTAAGTTVSSGATLQLQGGITVGAEALNINGSGASAQTGALVNVSGTNNYGGLLTLAGATTISSDSGTLNLTNAGTITGATLGLTLTGSGDGSISSIIGTTTGTLTKSGTGTWTLSGAGANTFTGATTVNDGTLQLNKTSGLNAYAGTLTVGDGVGSANSAVTRLLATNEMPATAVTVNSDGLLDLNGFSDSIGTLTMTGGNVTTGAGTLTLGGTLTGNASASSATITGNLGLGGNRNFSIADGAAAVDMNISAIVSGANNVTKQGTGTMVFSGANTFTGTTTVSAGVLNIQDVLALGTTAGATSVTAGAALQIQGGIAVGAEALTLNGSGIANDGALRNISGNNSMSGTVALASATAIGSDAGDLTLSGVVSGAFALTKVGAGTLTLSGAGANTYSGATTVNDGTLELNKTAGIAAYAGTLAVGDGTGSANSAVTRWLAGTQTPVTAVSINSDGWLDLNNFSDSVTTLAMTGGSVTTGTGTLTLGGTVTGNAAATSATISGKLTLGGNRNFNIGDGAAAVDMSISAVVSGANNATKQGTGTMVFSGANTYTGTTTVSAGVLNIQNDTGLGTTAAGTSVTSGATLQLQGGLTVGTETLSIAGTGAAGQTGALVNVSGTNNYGGLLTLTAATTISSDSGTLNLTNVGTITGNTFGLTLAGAGDGSISSIIGTTTGTLIKNGAGTWTLSGGNTYTGATTVSAGVLNIQNIAALGTTAAGTTVSSGATLQLQGGITFNAEALNINGSGASGETGALVNVSGTNSYAGLLTLAGATTISSDAGTLNLTNLGTITGATFGLTLGGASNGSISSIIGTTSGALIKNGAGSWTLTGVNTYTGGTTINGGTLLVNSATSLGATSGGATINAGTLEITTGYSTTRTFTLGDAASTFQVDPSQTFTVSSAIGGTGALNKTGTGTMVTSAANTYIGGTVLGAGTLQLSGLGTLGSTSGSLAVNGGTLDLNGTNQSVGALSGSGGTILNNSTATAKTLTVGTGGGTGSYASVIADHTSGTGTVALTKTGGGSQTLTGTNTYTGATTVNAGSLFVNGSTASASAVSVNNSGSTLGGSGTINGSINVASSGANLSPGASGVGSTAILHTGAVTLASGSNFNVDLNNTTAGSGYDQLTLIGTVSINGSNLVITAGAGLTIGQKFFIVLNDGSDAVTGTFAQGTTVISGPDAFSINYFDNGDGGSLGNDISLTVTAVPEPATYLAGTLALGALIWNQRRRLFARLSRQKAVTC